MFSSMFVQHKTVAELVICSLDSNSPFQGTVTKATRDEAFNYWCI
jgi:hypothetical protein